MLVQGQGWLSHGYLSDLCLKSFRTEDFRLGCNEIRLIPCVIILECLTGKAFGLVETSETIAHSGCLHHFSTSSPCRSDRDAPSAQGLAQSNSYPRLEASVKVHFALLNQLRSISYSHVDKFNI